MLTLFSFDQFYLHAAESFVWCIVIFVLLVLVSDTDRPLVSWVQCDHDDWLNYLFTDGDWFSDWFVYLLIDSLIDWVNEWWFGHFSSTFCLTQAITVTINIYLSNKNKNKQTKKPTYLTRFRIEVLFKNSTKIQIHPISFCNWFRSKFMILTFFLIPEKFQSLDTPWLRDMHIAWGCVHLENQ